MQNDIALTRSAQLQSKQPRAGKVLWLCDSCSESPRLVRFPTPLMLPGGISDPDRRAAFSPGVPLYLSFFYSRREIGFRQGIFLAGAPLASCYAGALAYGISHIKTSSLPVYKLLFLIEGAPAIPMAAVAYFFLPDKPSQARFLTPRQQEIARLRVARDGDTGRESRLKWRGVLNGLKDHKAWICS